MALYHHFPSKDALLDGLTDFLETEARPPASGATWQARLASIAKHQIEAALAHPRVASLMTSRRGATAAVFANNEDVLRALQEAGLDAKARVIWLRAFAAFVNGLAQYLVALKLRTGAAPSIDAKAYPLLAAAARIGPTLDSTVVLKAGLDALCKAIEQTRKMRG
jgi:AcrR family transcriptional regulator